MTETDLAWAAGFIDGEGCFYGGLMGNAGIRCSLSAGNCDLRPLKKLQKMFGGWVGLANKAKGNQRTSYSWALCGNHMLRSTIPLLVPYLVVKRENALAALKLLELSSVAFNRRGGIGAQMNGKKQRIVAKMRKLNHRGL